MSELSDAINEMRNMRESYDQIGAAAEAYNTGKTELAANITAKGVQASATETLPELADKVAAISQETYEINGGEMYAKQLFGSLDTPNYWNLYDVLANLLSDGRLVSYGGILLAEYYRGYDSLALSGAGAGGAYVVSDKDGDGNFIMYTADTTHTWATEFDGKGNRWVAYCFADEYHDFQITDTNTSPRSIFIGRKVGTISCLVNSRCSQVVVPDGNELFDFDAGSSSNIQHSWDRNLVFRNIKSVQHTLAYIHAKTESVYLEADELLGLGFGDVNSRTVKSVIAKVGSISGMVYRCWNYQIPNAFIFIEAESIILNSQYLIENIGQNSTIIIKSEEVGGTRATLHEVSNINLEMEYIVNDRTKSVVITQGASSINSISVQNGWMKPLNISYISSLLTAESIALNILDRLGDNTGQSQLTLKLGATALATIQNSQEWSSYLTDAIDNKNWNVIA